MISRDVLVSLFPSIQHVDEFVAALNTAFEYASINTPKRIAAFLAQTGHESAGYTVFTENLNYSSAGLRKTFPKYFPTQALADQYARKPEKIANRVYANRMGNGDEASGDGWRFRGRGVIQLTGRENVTRFSEAMGLTLEEGIDYLNTIDGACMAGAWYWLDRGLNIYADEDDFTALTRAINGGLNGWEDRLRYWEKAKSLLGIT